jgi:hypothetical protein
MQLSFLTHRSPLKAWNYSRSITVAAKPQPGESVLRSSEVHTCGEPDVKQRKVQWHMVKW